MAEYGPIVRRRIAALVGEDDADDVCQATWLSVWRHLASFRGDAAVSSWLFRVATNHAFSHLRRSHRRRLLSATLTLPDTDDPIELTQFLDPSPSPERVCASRREYAAVRSAIARRLTSDQRTALIAFVRGDTDAVISTRLGIPRETVKSRVFRARARLRSHREKLQASA